MGLFTCLSDQIAAKLCIPKIVFTICDARKVRSDEFFLYLTVCYWVSDWNGSPW